MCSEVGVRVMVTVGRVYVRAYPKLVRFIEKYFLVLMVEVRVHANFIIIYVADELRMELPIPNKVLLSYSGL